MSDHNESGSNEGFESDDFGDFDDFDEMEQAQPVAPSDPAPSAHTVQQSLKFGTNNIKTQTQDLLKKSSRDPVVPSEDRFTRTAVQLWHQLMENPSAAFLQWEGSSLHRKLVQSFGVPLNLDKALPKVKTRQMSLETTPSDMQHISDWTLLSIVSKEAIDGMDDKELSEYNTKLEQAIKDARQLHENLEGQEMDLRGEKDVLEGMVDSLLAYTQKSQRDSMLKKK